MVRFGVSEWVAMSISGHKTRSIFDRYNIVSDRDLQEAARKKQAYHQKQAVAEQEKSGGRGDMVPEVGIPSICSGQAPRHGVEAPRDFESSPQPQAISHHFQLLKN